MDTLKEIADWIASDESNSADLLASINANKDAIATLNGADTVTGSVDQKIKSAVEALDATVEDTAGSELVSVKVVEADGKLTSVTVTDKREFVSVEEVQTLFNA